MKLKEFELKKGKKKKEKLGKCPKLVLISINCNL
jgi:hypothetical protein